ncbi:hypothetical protein ADUPG1_009914, partial [Aduncisulcus paluster]
MHTDYYSSASTSMDIDDYPSPTKLHPTNISSISFPFSLKKKGVLFGPRHSTDNSVLNSHDPITHINNTKTEPSSRIKFRSHADNMIKSQKRTLSKSFSVSRIAHFCFGLFLVPVLVFSISHVFTGIFNILLCLVSWLEGPNSSYIDCLPVNSFYLNYSAGIDIFPSSFYQSSSINLEFLPKCSAFRSFIIRVHQKSSVGLFMTFDFNISRLSQVLFPIFIFSICAFFIYAWISLFLRFWLGGYNLSTYMASNVSGSSNHGFIAPSFPHTITAESYSGGYGSNSGNILPNPFRPTTGFDDGSGGGGGGQPSFNTSAQISRGLIPRSSNHGFIAPSFPHTITAESYSGGYGSNSGNILPNPFRPTTGFDDGSGGGGGGQPSFNTSAQISRGLIPSRTLSNHTLQGSSLSSTGSGMPSGTNAALINKLYSYSMSLSSPANQNTSTRLLQMLSGNIQSTSGQINLSKRASVTTFHESDSLTLSGGTGPHISAATRRDSMLGSDESLSPASEGLLQATVLTKEHVGQQRRKSSCSTTTATTHHHNSGSNSSNFLQSPINESLDVPSYCVTTHGISGSGSGNGASSSKIIQRTLEATIKKVKLPASKSSILPMSHSSRPGTMPSSPGVRYMSDRETDRVKNNNNTTRGDDRMNSILQNNFLHGNVFTSPRFLNQIKTPGLVIPQFNASVAIITGCIFLLLIPMFKTYFFIYGELLVLLTSMYLVLKSLLIIIHALPFHSIDINVSFGTTCLRVLNGIVLLLLKAIGECIYIHIKRRPYLESIEEYRGEKNLYHLAFEFFEDTSAQFDETCLYPSRGVFLLFIILLCGLLVNKIGHGLVTLRLRRVSEVTSRTMNMVWNLFFQYDQSALLSNFVKGIFPAPTSLSSAKQPRNMTTPRISLHTMSVPSTNHSLHHIQQQSMSMIGTNNSINNNSHSHSHTSSHTDTDGAINRRRVSIPVLSTSSVGPLGEKNPKIDSPSSSTHPSGQQQSGQQQSIPKIVIGNEKNHNNNSVSSSNNIQHITQHHPLFKGAIIPPSTTISGDESNIPQPFSDSSIKSISTFLMLLLSHSPPTHIPSSWKSGDILCVGLLLRRFAKDNRPLRVFHSKYIHLLRFLKYYYRAWSLQQKILKKEKTKRKRWKANHISSKKIDSKASSSSCFSSSFFSRSRQKSKHTKTSLSRSNRSNHNQGEVSDERDDQSGGTDAGTDWWESEDWVTQSSVVSREENGGGGRESITSRASISSLRSQSVGSTHHHNPTIPQTHQGSSASRHSIGGAEIGGGRDAGADDSHIQVYDGVERPSIERRMSATDTDFKTSTILDHHPHQSTTELVNINSSSSSIKNPTMSVV